MRVVKKISVDYPGLNLRIRQKREEEGLTMAEFARRTGFTRAHVRNVELGIEKTISWEFLRQCEKVLKHNFGVILNCPCYYHHEERANYKTEE
ncbi:MAG: helix-turn-helix transcriptional regulator [Moorea sp. SIO4G2]|nr:helix-turn-helix transcriptional regulator [Moorena sp. SIO4G2]